MARLAEHAAFSQELMGLIPALTSFLTGWARVGKIRPAWTRGGEGGGRSVGRVLDSW